MYSTSRLSPTNIKVSNLINIAKAFGYEVILQKGKEKLALHDEIKNKKHHLSVVVKLQQFW